MKSIRQSLLFSLLALQMFLPPVAAFMVSSTARPRSLLFSPNQLLRAPARRCLRPRDVPVRVGLSSARTATSSADGIEDPEALLKYLNDKSGTGLSFGEYQQLEQLKEYLRNCPVFIDTSAFDCQRLAQSMEKVKVAEGETLIRQGEKGADAMYFVVDGKFDCVADGDEEGTAGGGEGSLQLLTTYQKPGDYFGELALLFDQPRAASIVATEDSTVFRLDKGAFLESVVDSPVYDTARQILLKKYSSKNLREILSKVRVDEIVDLAKAKLQPKKKSVSSDSVLATYSMGACSAVLASLWSPGRDASGWPMLFDLSRLQGLSRLPVLLASFLLSTTAVLGVLALPKEEPSKKQIWHSVGGLMSTGLGVFIGSGRAKSNGSLLLLQLLICIRTAMTRSRSKDETKLVKALPAFVVGALAYEAIRPLFPLLLR